MRTLTNGDLTVVAFDYAVYKQERNVLRCTYTGAYTSKNVTVDIINGSTRLATYNMNTAGKCFIDLTDYLRTYNTGSLTVTAKYDGADVVGSVYVDWSVIGLISPTRLFVPDTPEAAEVRASANKPSNYLLPSKIVQPIGTGKMEVYGAQGAYLLKSTDALRPHMYYNVLEGGNNDPSIPIPDYIIDIYRGVFGLTRTYAQIAPYLVDNGDQTFEYRFADIQYTDDDEASRAADEIEAYIHSSAMAISVSLIYHIDTGSADTVENQVTSTTFDALTIDGTTHMVGVALGTKEVVQSVIVQKRLCGVTYADVRWISATGHERIATMELREHTVAVGDKLNIDSADGEYDERKGREDNMVLRLQGLTQYDIWYYGDIVTSSSVEISLDGSTWRTVRVTSKDVTIPDGNGGELQELKVSITYADYDAVAM